jgi:hypothetical protein
LYVSSNLAWHQGLSEEEATQRAGIIFRSLDKNNDGSLEEEEFVMV